MVEEAISFWTDIQRYEDMLAADPSSYCFVPLSELYRKLGLLDDAISVAKKGSERHPDYPAGFFALGAALNAKGEKDQARGALERAVSLKEDNVEALKLLGQLCVESGEIDRAKTVLIQALRHDPQDTETELLLRSIAPEAAIPQPEEEIIEDVEIIEDLEEVDELAPSPAVAPEVAASVAQGAPYARPEEGGARGSKEEPAAFLEQSTDFWGIGMPGEGTGSQTAEPEEEEFSGFDASDELETPAAGTAAGAAAVAADRRDPLSTATLAELYVSQGHLAKALGIYQQLLAEDPGNHSYRQRVVELRKMMEQPLPPQEAAAKEPAPQEPPVQKAPVEEPPVQKPPIKEPPAQEPPAQKPPVQAQPVPAAAGEEGGVLPPTDLESQLTGWLENIRRRRDGV